MSCQLSCGSFIIWLATFAEYLVIELLHLLPFTFRLAPFIAVMVAIVADPQLSCRMPLAQLTKKDSSFVRFVIAKAKSRFRFTMHHCLPFRLATVDDIMRCCSALMSFWLSKFGVGCSVKFKVKQCHFNFKRSITHLLHVCGDALVTERDAASGLAAAPTGANLGSSLEWAASSA